MAKLLFLAILGPKGNVKRCLARESIDRADAFDCNLGERGKNEFASLLFPWDLSEFMRMAFSIIIRKPKHRI